MIAVNPTFVRELGNLDHLFHTPEPIVEWAERNVIVRVSNRAGMFKCDPPQRGVLEAIGDPEINQVTKMFSSQLGKTLIDTIGLSWYIDQKPCPMMFMHASQAGLDKFLREKLEPILGGCESLESKIHRNNRGKIPPVGFSFDGGYCTLTTARSVSSKHGTSAEVLFGDEVDDYKGATLVSSLRQRTITFDDKKLVLSSTPTLHGYSQIEIEYMAGSQSMWYAKCVHCDFDQILEWVNVRGINLVCANSNCEAIWSEGDRIQSINRGEWVETVPNQTHKSFWMSQLYSYNVTLEETVNECANYTKQELYTQVLAWPFEEVEIPEADASLIKRLPEPPFKPRYVAVGADVQQNRIEYAVWLFDANLEKKHLAHYDVVLRSTAEITMANLRRQMTPFRPMRVGIDGSYDFDWVALGIQKIFPDALILKNPPIEIMRGYSQESFGKPLRGARGHGYIWVATDEAKSIIYQDIVKGHITFDEGVPLASEEQITSEKLIRTQINTRLKRNWVKVSPHIRNELLDMTVYAYAAILGLDQTPPGPGISVSSGINTGTARVENGEDRQLEGGVSQSQNEIG